MNRSILRAIGCVVMLFITFQAGAQKIQNHYVSAAQEDGTIYHILPKRLFEHPEYGRLSLDVTYKERQQGLATVNFTYRMPRLMRADSICFSIGDQRLMSGAVSMIYVEPNGKEWLHRYSLSVPFEALMALYNVDQLPTATIYGADKIYIYPVRRKAWGSFAPVGSRIVEVIRVNEER